MAKDFDDWIMSLEIYFTVHHEKFLNDKKRSLAVLARMKRGTAGPWAKVLLQVKLNATTPPDSVWFTWNQLKAELTTIFKDHTAGQKAQEKLENLRQGKHSIDEFFSLFETLTVECNLTSEPKQLIYFLEQNVNERIMLQIITTQEPPTDYDTYKAIILRIGRYHEKRDNQLHQQNN
jgi:hypothetical protein